MLKQVSKTIGEHEYLIRQLNAVQGRNVFLRFAKLVAPALEKIAGGEDLEKTGVNKGRFLEALAIVAANCSEEDQTFFCEVFAKSTDLVSTNDRGARVAPNLSSVFSLHFAGDNLPAMYEWLYACFEVNFGSFFAKLGATRGSTAPQPTA